MPTVTGSCISTSSRGNILIDAATQEGLPKVADFGLARAIDQGNPTRSGGTPAFMAPEQFEGVVHELGPWTDLYALAGVAVAMVTGEPPFRTSTLGALRTAHRSHPAPVLEGAYPVPAGLDAWIARMMAKLPEQRFRSAVQAAAALRALGGSPKDEAEPWHISNASPRRRWTQLDAGLNLFGLRRAPMVGREAERRAIWGQWDAMMADRRTRILLLSGPQGCGISRLVDWATERMRERGVGRVVHLRCGPGRGRRQTGLIGLLVHLLQLGSLRGERLTIRIQRKLASLGRCDDAFVRDVAALVEASSPPSQRDASIVMRLLSWFCEVEPLIVTIDDAHRAPDLVRLAYAVSGMPQPALFVLGAHDHDEPLPVAPMTRFAMWCSVPRLSRDEHRAVLHGHLPLGPTLTHRLLERTAGDAAFAVDSLADLVRRRALTLTPEGYELTDGDAMELPPNLSALWERRIDTLLAELPPGAEHALAVAAALGPEVRRITWWAADVAPSAIAGLHLRLREEGWIRPTIGGFRFVSAAFRGAVLQRYGKRRGWATLHRACARALQVDGRDAARVAEHLAEAGEFAAALDALQQALPYTPQADMARLLRQAERWVGGLPEGDRRSRWVVGMCNDRTDAW